ncbi:MAG: pilus assembly protein [Rickettsiales bacterium]|nr:pilus assembly protein [Rickettsiales bacterium]
MSIRQFLKGNHGVALIEFSVAFPFLLIIFLGMAELAYHTIVTQKVDKVASSMADFVTQGRTASRANLNDFGLAVPQIMRPFRFSGTVIFSSASRRVGGANTTGSCPNNTTCINWQHRILGTAASRIGTPGGVPVMPGGYVIQNNQNVIIAEAFLNYSPLLSISSNFIPAFRPKTIYKVSVFKPRQGAFLVLNP